ncbi:MAG: monovalent cation:proton antiporter-2 (CPA2) family protein [Rhodobacteraceae bacterium]|nr:monovalent cation:proton antiporter-2 (CPA2) family protein [Paracoccaceae bacterium]
MAGMGENEFLQAAAIYLGAGVVAVPLFKRMKLGSVLGYLAAGALIGPHALGFIPEAETALHASEFGVVLLLFVIGLELKPERLWRLRMEIFGLGLCQVAVTGIVIFAAAWMLGFDWRASIAAGAGLALSSTAFAIQILRERGDLATPYGDRAFAILLFQDLAIVPILALIAFIAPAAGESHDPTWLAMLKAVGAIGAVVLAGRYGLKPLFHMIALTKADEVFTAAALLVVIASALAMDAAGLSMAMGAFIAGVLLADTEFRHQLETDIEPFRGLLMGLFFIAVGMSVDIGLVIDNAIAVLAAVLCLIAAKTAILFALARGAGSKERDAMRIAAVLSQGGEFGFVIFTVASASAVMDPGSASLLAAIVTLSMAATPVMMLAATRWIATRTEENEEAQPLRNVKEAPKSPILIAGFGRFGQVIGRILRLRGYDVTLIDNNPRRIQVADSFGSEVFFGDARRLDTLANAGAADAKAIFLCIDDRDGARQAVERIRSRFPGVKIYASTYDRFTMLELEKAGADIVERESFESAIALAKKALEEFGDGAVIEDLVAEFRRRDQQLLRLQAEYGAREGLRRLREGFSLEKER